jgi:hypothetical protein
MAAQLPHAGDQVTSPVTTAPSEGVRRAVVGLRAWFATTRLDALAAVSVALLLLVTHGTPQGLFSDPAWQMKAVQQYTQGRSPSINTLTVPADRDLADDAAEWIFFWAPGTPLLAYPAVAAGLTEGQTIRSLTGACLLVGALGWCRWFRLFELPRRTAIALTLAMPWIHYASNNLFFYSAEALVFASVPWLLVATWACGRRFGPQGRFAAVIGFAVGVALGAEYWLKYSAFLVSFGAGAYLAITAFRQRRAVLGAGGLLLPVLAGVCLPVAVLTVLNLLNAGQPNLLTVGHVWPLPWRTALAAIGNPALAVADADGLLNYLLSHPGRSVIDNHVWLEMMGVPGTIAAIWVLAQSRRWSDVHVLAACVPVCSLVAMLAIWTVSPVSFEARHLTISTMAVLPAVLVSGELMIRRTRRSLRRAVVVSAGVAYLAVPGAYGVLAVGAKVARTHGYRPGPSGLYNPLLAAADAASVTRLLSRETTGPADLWYLTEPMSSLDLPGRAILRHADFMDLPQLERDRFASSAPLRIHALLPPSFELNGKGRVIRAAFGPDAAWSSTSVEGCNYLLWRADVGVAR